MVRGIQLRQVLGSIPVLFFFAADPDVGGIVLGLGLVATLALVAVIRVLAWQRHTYEFADGRIIERSGIISRNERALEIDRIQQVDVERTLLDRAVGTCELRLETAADTGESELRLRVVSVEEAGRLRGLLADRVARRGASTEETASAASTASAVAPTPDAAGTHVGAEAAAEEVLVEVPLGHVALAAVTGPRLLAIPAAVAVLFGVVVENAAPDQIVDTAGDVVTGLSVVGGVVLFAVLAIGSILAAAVWGVVRDGGFTIGQRGSDLLVRRGLTTTRSATVPMRRVQRVTVRRRWLQDVLGFASVTVHSAGGGGGQGGSELDRSLTVPLLPAADVDALVGRLLGSDATPELRPHPSVARRRSIVRGLLGALPPAAALGVFGVVSGRTGLVVVAVLALLAGAVGGWFAYDRMGFGADGQVVAGRTGLLGTTTEISPLRKTQGTTVHSSWFQRRLGLATLAVHVAGPAGGIELQDLGEVNAQRLAPTLHR